MSFRHHVVFFLLYRHADEGAFDDFLKISNHFVKIYKDFPKLFWRQANVPQQFPKISKDFRRLPKTFEEDPKVFQLYTNKFKYNLRDKLDISEIIDIFTSEDMKNMPLESWM